MNPFITPNVVKVYMWNNTALEAFVNGLSRGMKQRLCLAKTLVHDPPVLILDEPTSGLDPRARIEVKALFKELRRRGKTILLSSHILSELPTAALDRHHRAGQAAFVRPDRRGLPPHRRNRIVNIRFLEHLEAGLAVVRSLPETREVRVEDRSRAPWSLQPTTTRWPACWRSLWPPARWERSFAEKEPTLEDVFMMVTKGDVA